jgi:uncharacterized membrane protein YedE/YeeE
MSGALAALGGGALIGVAAAALLVGNGRIAGISGILAGALRPRSADAVWRLWFLAGLVGGGALLGQLFPEAFPASVAPAAPWLVGAGLLVGVGTRMGGGCTSGHGVCGIGHGSLRSLVAVLTFMGTAALTVAIVAIVGGRR